MTYLTPLCVSPQPPFPTSASFNQEVETALESFDFLNCSDLDEEEEEEQEDRGEKEEERGEKEEQDNKCKEDQNKKEEEEIKEEEKNVENLYCGGRSVSVGTEMFVDRVHNC